MSDADKSRQLAGGSDWWESLGRLCDDGVIQRLLLGKTTANAIQRLIGAGMSLPIAGIENLEERIKANTAGLKKVRNALANAAAKAAVDDPALVDRAVTRLAGDAMRKQMAREDVAVRALNILNDDPPDTTSSAEPSEDFMAFFEDVVEKASSESLRDMMARILAGEIRKPGSVSRRSLQAVATMDQQVAQALWNIRPWLTWDNRLPMIGGYNSSSKRLEVELLDSASIMRSGSGLQHMELNANREGFLPYSEDTGIVLTWGLSFNPQWPVVNVTSIGVELLNILPRDERKHGRELALSFKEIPFIEKIEWCHFRRDGHWWHSISREVL